MLINRKATMAVRCPWCGNIRINKVDPFSISGGDGITAKCMCGQDLFTLKKRQAGGYQLNISCIACDYEHIYRLGYRELWKSDLFILNCHYTNMEVCFLGSETNVKQAVDRYEREMEEIIKELGIEEFLEDEDLWSDSFTRFLDSVEKVNYNKELGKNIVDLIARGPKHSK
ncbi:MAG: hypothetical protein ACOX42_11845 [Clostridia bacterium]|jgi:hypothetical protein|nr:hypothetical protein [Clostridiales bacterium]